MRYSSALVARSIYRDSNLRGVYRGLSRQMIQTPIPITSIRAYLSSHAREKMTICAIARSSNTLDLLFILRVPTQA